MSNYKAPQEWLDEVFERCAEFMNDWDGDEPHSPADVLASYEDMSGVEFTEPERAHLSQRLAPVAKAIAEFGPAL